MSKVVLIHLTLPHHRSKVNSCIFAFGIKANKVFS